MMSFAQWIMAVRWFNQADFHRTFEAAKRSQDLAPTPADRTWADATLAVAYCRAGNPKQAVAILATLVPDIPGGPLHPKRKLHAVSR